MYENIKGLKLSRRGKVLTIAIDNPPVNTMTPLMHTELSHIFYDINRDPDTAVVVITGMGEKAFSAGGDVQTMARRAEENKIGEYVPGFIEARHILRGMLTLERPLIGRINGHAMGLGSTIAAFCDVSFMLEKAKIADNHVSVGITAGDGGALMWPLLMGYQKAKYHLLTGDALTGKEAAEAGLISHSCATIEEMDEKVYALADRLAGGASIAINTTKKAVNLMLVRQFDNIIENHLELEMHSFYSEDHKEAATAFRDKRTPTFTGK